jgi:hypothetical protein
MGERWEDREEKEEEEEENEEDEEDDKEEEKELGRNERGGGRNGGGGEGEDGSKDSKKLWREFNGRHLFFKLSLRERMEMVWSSERAGIPKPDIAIGKWRRDSIL